MDVCGAKFRLAQSLKQHTLIHTDKRPHECDVCGAKFRLHEI